MARTDDDLPTAQEIRESFGPEPGKGHLAEAALAERANTVAYGGDTAAVDKRLAALGLGPEATKADHKAAAAERKAALEELSSGTGRSGADPAPPAPPEAPEAPEPEPGAEPAAGDAAASGQGGPAPDGDPAEAEGGDGGDGTPARKRVTPGRKPGGPKVHDVTAWLLAVRQDWACPNCPATDTTALPVANRYHRCPGLGGGLIAPLVPAGADCKVIALPRQDYLAGEIQRHGGDGRPYGGVAVVRADGSNDLHMFAPLAQVSADEAGLR